MKRDPRAASKTGKGEHRLEVEPSLRWVRVFFAGVFVADSRRVKLARETGHLPVYYFPREDVRFEHLVPSETRTRCPIKGEAVYWSVEVGDRVAQDAVWAYPDPIPSAADLRDHVAFYWDRMDRWFEEDVEVYVHPRDPYHRVDALPSSRHVQVVVGGEVVADSRRPVLVFETGLPTRYYFPKPDVRLDRLVPTEKRTRCPYKGEASYFSVRTRDGLVPDLAWTYPYTTTAAAPLGDHIAFYDERVDEVRVDGVPQERPESPFA